MFDLSLFLAGGSTLFYELAADALCSQCMQPMRLSVPHSSASWALVVALLFE